MHTGFHSPFSGTLGGVPDRLRQPGQRDGMSSGPRGGESHRIGERDDRGSGDGIGDRP